MMDTIEAYACYTVKIYKYQPLKNFKQGGDFDYKYHDVFWH